MNKLEKVALVSGSALAIGLAGFGGYTLADSYWAGHNDIVQINSDIDKLTGEISAKQKELNDSKGSVTDLQKHAKDLTTELNQANANYKTLQGQKDTEEASLQQQIQGKIAETQQAISEGNAKVNAKQQEINQLNQQIDQLKQNQKNPQETADLKQALKDVQDTRAKADSAVQQNVASSSESRGQK